MKKAMRRMAVATLAKKIVVTAVLALTTATVHAQYAGSQQTITLDNLTSNRASDFTVGGGSYWGDVLVITNSGKLVVTGSGWMGNAAASSNNTAVVTGPGSVWSNSAYCYIGTYGSSNQLTIANGGYV